MELKNVLRTVMKEQKFTFKKLSTASGVSQSTLKDWANGVAPRDLEAVKKVAIALGVSFEFLCFGAESTSMTPESALDAIPTQILHSGWVKILIEVPSRDKNTNSRRTK